PTDPRGDPLAPARPVEGRRGRPGRPGGSGRPNRVIDIRRVAAGDGRERRAGDRTDRRSGSGPAWPPNTGDIEQVVPHRRRSLKVHAVTRKSTMGPRPPPAVGQAWLPGLALRCIVRLSPIVVTLHGW